MKKIRFLDWVCFLGSAVLLAQLLLMDFGVLPIRGTEFSRVTTHISVLLVMGSSLYRLFF